MWHWTQREISENVDTTTITGIMPLFFPVTIQAGGFISLRGHNHAQPGRESESTDAREVGPVMPSPTGRLVTSIYIVIIQGIALWITDYYLKA